MAGINKEDLLEEGYLESDLLNMQGWDDNLKRPIEDGYLIFGNIITSISYEFVKFFLAFAKLVGIHISPKSFGL